MCCRLPAILLPTPRSCRLRCRAAISGCSRFSGGFKLPLRSFVHWMHFLTDDSPREAATALAHDRAALVRNFPIAWQSPGWQGVSARSVDQWKSILCDGPFPGQSGYRAAISRHAGDCGVGSFVFTGRRTAVSSIPTAFFRGHAKSRSLAGDAGRCVNEVARSAEGIHGSSRQSDSGAHRRVLAGGELRSRGEVGGWVGARAAIYRK